MALWKCVNLLRLQFHPLTIDKILENRHIFSGILTVTASYPRQNTWEKCIHFSTINLSTCVLWAKEIAHENAYDAFLLAQKPKMIERCTDSDRYKSVSSSLRPNVITKPKDVAGTTPHKVQSLDVWAPWVRINEIIRKQNYYHQCWWYLVHSTSGTKIISN